MEINSKYIQTWDPTSVTSTIKKSKIPIIHVIGLVGAGKSTFIQKYFSNLPVFDIKNIYKANNFNPKDLHDNPGSYPQFKSALDYSFSNFYKNLEVNNIPIGIVESSGINKGINEILGKFFVYGIWIIPDHQRMKEKKIYEDQPYAKDLNKHMMNLLNHRKIIYNNAFDFKSYEFSKNLPPLLRKFIS